MSSDVEQDAGSEREQIYKRGYAHGVARSLSAFTGKLNDTERETMAAWLKDVLTPWEQDAAPSIQAPDFPAI